MAEDWHLPEQVINLLSQARAEHWCVVLATGVFDLLHQEHKLFLQKAREHGDILLVGIESDVRVRALKGSGRPVQSAEVRCQAVSALSTVSAAFILPESFATPEAHRALIGLVRPNILAVSSHSLHLEKKKAILQEFGGDVVVVHQHNPEISTSRLLRSAQSE